MKPYQKTPDDIKIEEYDLKNHPVMRWLENKDKLSFKPGDILIKKTKTHSANGERKETWRVEPVSKANSAPKKYIFCFENKHGVGYIRQLAADGVNTHSNLICLANVDPNTTIYELDPDYVDHLLVGEDEFKPNEIRRQQAAHRQQMIKKNREIIVRTNNMKELAEWIKTLQLGSEFWYSYSMEGMTLTKVKVTAIRHVSGQIQTSWLGTVDKKEVSLRDHFPLNQVPRFTIEYLSSPYPNQVGNLSAIDVHEFIGKYISEKPPFPLNDVLCAPQK